MDTIDKIITLAEFSAAIGASVTIAREDVPALLKALAPAIKKRNEYFKRLQARVNKQHIKIKR